MAIAVAAYQAYLFDNRVTYGPWANVDAPPVAQKLPNGIASPSANANATTLSTQDAKSMLSEALLVATSIVSVLKNIEDSVKLAASAITSSSAAAVTTDGTRISVGNIQAGIDQTLAGIDRLVDGVKSGQANILSSTSHPIAIQTSVYGGKINIQPQAFDAQGLGIANLDLHTSHGRTDALARVGMARLTAQKRLMSLQGLHNGLGDPNAMDNATYLAGASNASRGVLVNLSA